MKVFAIVCLTAILALAIGAPAISAEEVETPGVVTFESVPVIVVSPGVVSQKGGEVTISGVGFIPGDAIWIKIASADADEQDVFLTKELVQINEYGAFAITVNGKDALKTVVVEKKGVFVVKTVSGKQRAATAPIVITE